MLNILKMARRSQNSKWRPKWRPNFLKHVVTVMAFNFVKFCNVIHQTVTQNTIFYINLLNDVKTTKIQRSRLVEF